MTAQATPMAVKKRLMPHREGPSGGATAIILIGVSVALMTIIGVAGKSAAVADVGSGILPLHVNAAPSDRLVSVLCWAAIVTGALGSMAGLMALARGWRPRPRTLLIAAVITVTVLTLVSVAGSTDALDYAVYGRIAALGHDPYTLTPSWLVRVGDPIGQYAPASWRHTPSLYGPVAVALFGLASIIGGTSMAATVFVLKVMASAAFLATGFGLDRLTGPDPAARARVHLLWTLNPVMLWGMVVGAHIDAVAAALIVGAILVLRGHVPHLADRIMGRAAAPGILAGILLGVATATKLPYVLAGVGLIWMVRRSPVTILCGTLATAAVAGGAYLITGPSATSALTNNAGGRSEIDPWSFLDRHFHFLRPLTTSAGPLAILSFVALSALVWWSLSQRTAASGLVGPGPGSPRPGPGEPTPGLMPLVSVPWPRRAGSPSGSATRLWKVAIAARSTVAAAQGRTVTSLRIEPATQPPEPAEDPNAQPLRPDSTPRPPASDAQPTGAVSARPAHTQEPTADPPAPGTGAQRPGTGATLETGTPTPGGDAEPQWSDAATPRTDPVTSPANAQHPATSGTPVTTAPASGADAETQDPDTATPGADPVPSSTGPQRRAAVGTPESGTPTSEAGAVASGMNTQRRATGGTPGTGTPTPRTEPVASSTDAGSGQAGLESLGVAVLPAFAIALGWLATSPYQHPWYDAMLFPLLALLPRTRLDALVLARAAVASIGYSPGDPLRLSPLWFNHLVKGDLMPRVVPFTLDLILIAMCLVCLTRLPRFNALLTHRRRA